jgi:RND family efflux transporter MFP subunit
LRPYRHLAGAVLLFALTILIGCKRDTERESETKKRVDPAVVTRTTEGDPLIRMDQAAQSRVGIEVASVTPTSLQPQIIAYGHLEEDPSRSFVVRAPVAGTVQVPAGGAWPSTGQTLNPGQAVGVIEPRIAPAERIALTTQLSSARSEADSAAAAAEASRAAYERARVLNADNKNVSDRVLEEARARLEAERARLDSARTNTRTLENALRVSGPAAYRLTADAGGTVVETMARPGESVEAGLPLLRISHLDKLVARVDLPVGQNLPQSATLARIVPAAHESAVIPADRVAAVPVIDPKSPGESFLFRLREGRFGLRPGLAVTAYLPLPGASRQGFTIPTAAVVRSSGKAYVYVQTAADRFVRREIKVESPVASGCFVTGRLAAGDRIVITGAQTLLSEEFKPESVQEE